jgi:hypothetical protein
MPQSPWMRVFAALACAQALACTEAPPVAGDLDGGDAGADAGASSDAGPDADAGTDAGTSTDSGTGADAGADAADAGAGADAGADAGDDAGEDAGPRAYPWTPAPATGSVDPEWLGTPPACSPGDWLAKYFNYRTRLRGNGTGAFPGFVSIGAAPGQSLMFGERIPDGGCDSHWWFVGASCTNHNVAQTKGIYGLGDGVIWLGWYLTHLALEHAAFRALGVPLDQNVEELHRALQAFDRLDVTAETHYGIAGRLDGFYQRDDVPADFIWKDSAHTLLRFPRSDGFAGYGCVKSTAGCGTMSIADGSFESQDQQIGLMLGLAMIAKLVPGDAQHEGVGLLQKARTIAHRTVKFLRDNGWKIKDPNGNIPPNQWGGSAVPYSNEIAKAANFITGNAFGISDYRDTITETEGAALFAGVDASWAAQTGINKSLALKLAAMTDVWGAEKLARRALGYGVPTHAIINALLHDRPVHALVSPWDLDALLTSAPCGGPCLRSPGCVETPGWMGANRWGSPEDRSGGHFLTGEYNGNDYLVLHDLVLLARGGKYSFTFPAQPHCASSPLEDLFAAGVPSGATYDPWGVCAPRDFARVYCGRTFAAWLDAAYRGEATLFLGDGKLTCTGDQPCTVSAASGYGTSGADLFIGGEGTDSFDGVDGDDCLYGGGGMDELHGGRGYDEIHGGDGADTLCGENCSVADLEGESDVIYGDAGEDQIWGGPEDDEIFGGSENDTIDCGGGSDWCYGEGGDDFIDGELGEDYIDGGPGNDELHGGIDQDNVSGGEGRDKIDGEAGDDTLKGGPGDDLLRGEDGDDTLWGEDGDDRLCGGCGRDALNGGWSSGDDCREEAFPCLSDPTGTMDGCGTMNQIGASDCNDTAFDGW